MATAVTVAVWALEPHIVKSCRLPHNYDTRIGCGLCVIQRRGTDDPYYELIFFWPARCQFTALALSDATLSSRKNAATAGVFFFWRQQVEQMKTWATSRLPFMANALKNREIMSRQTARRHMWQSQTPFSQRTHALFVLVPSSLCPHQGR